MDSFGFIFWVIVARYPIIYLGVSFVLGVAVGHFI